MPDLRLSFGPFLRLSLKEYRAQEMKGGPWTDALLDEQVERCLEAWQRYRKRKAKAAVSDADWYAGLRADFAGVDIATQETLARTWAKRHERKFTRKFFDNWLQKALRDALASGVPAAGMTQASVDPEPSEWLEFLKANYPDWVGFTDGTAQRPWAALSRGDKDMIRTVINQARRIA